MIPRGNPHLNEAIDALNEHFLRCGGNAPRAWSSLSKDELQFIDTEVEHCLNDARYFLENYYIVKTEQEGLKTLYPFWESQEIFYEVIADIQAQKLPVRVQCLKARQQGISTISDGLIFWKTIFTPVSNALIIATDGQQSAFLFDMARTAYDLLPWWMQPEKRYEQAGKLLQFDCVDETARQANQGLKSNVYVEAANKMTGAARGKSIRALHACLSEENLIFDELGYVKSIADVDVGSSIMTPDGLATVTAFSSRPSSSVYRGAEDGYLITPWCNGAFPVKGTGNHRVLCRDLGRVPNRGENCEKAFFVMKELREITSKDSFVVPVRPIASGGMPIPGGITTEPRKHGGGKTATWSPPPPSRELGFAFGLYLAEGSALPGKVAISLDKDEQGLADRFAAAVGYEYGKPIPNKLSRTMVYYFYNSAMSYWFEEHLGAKDAKRMPLWMWENGEDFLSGVVEGMIVGDGHLHKGQNTIGFTTIRAHLALGIRDAVASLGWGYGAIITRQAGFHYGRNCKQIWTVTFGQMINAQMRDAYDWGDPVAPSKRNTSHGWYTEDKKHVYVSVRKVERTKLDVVYDIEVDTEDHVFNLPGGITHNSELASWDDGGQLTRAIFPTMNSDDTLAILESTAEGRSGFWYTFWRETVAGKTDWTPVFIEFFRVKKYSRPFKDGEIFTRTKDEQSFVERINADQDVVITDEVLNWMRRKKQEFIATDGDEFNFFGEYPCLVGSTRVPTEEGVIRLDKVREGMVTGGKKITAFLSKGEREVYRATTALGYVIEGTADHKVPTAQGDYGLKELEGKIIYLSPPELSSAAVDLRWSGPCTATCSIPVDEEFARFLGYFLGDGSYCSDSVSIACDAKDEDVVADVSRLMQKFFGNARSRLMGSKKGCTELRVGSKGFKQVMQAAGIWNLKGRPHRLVRVPEVIMCSPKHIVAEFLRGLFEADGFNAHQSQQISFFSKHTEFLRDVQLLLLGFGITSRRTRKNKINGEGRTYFGGVLCLRGNESRRFLRDIGFVGKRKQERSLAYDGPLGRPCLDVPKHDVVVSVEAVGQERVYDITVEPGHTFSANGILVHNCNWQEAFQGTGKCAFDKRQLQKINESQVCAPHWVGEITWNEEEQKIVFSGAPGGGLRRVEKGEQLQQPEWSDRFRVWEKPDQEEEYYVAVDVAMGNEGGDFSCIEVLKIGRGALPDEQVAEWRGWINPVPLAYAAVGMARWYNEAQISVEVNAVGITTNNEVQRVIEYDNIYRWKHIDKIKGMMTDHTGWYTNFKSRDVIISKMAEAILSRTIILRSEWLLDEMLDFAQDDDGGKFQGQDTSDDRVMSMLICHYCAHDSDAGKRAAARPMSGKKGSDAKYYVMDAMNRKIAEITDREKAVAMVYEHKGWSFVQAPEARDFHNTIYSPIYNGDGIRSRMYNDLGYAAEAIDHSTVSEAEAEETAQETEGPNDWLFL